jgi:hypothetical protein
VIRAALAAAMLSGCTIVEHIQVVPFVDSSAQITGCCAAYVEIPPSTQLSASVQKTTKSVQFKAGAKWKF